MSSPSWCWARQERRVVMHALIRPTQRLYVRYWAGKRLFVFLLNSLIMEGALCHCYQKVSWTKRSLSDFQQSSWTRKCPTREWLLFCFFFFAFYSRSPQNTLSCFLPGFSLDHVKTPIKETNAPLLSSRSECYVVEVSVIIHLNALCQSGKGGAGVVLPCSDLVTQYWLEGFCGWRSVLWMWELLLQRLVLFYTGKSTCGSFSWCFSSEQLVMSTTLDQISISW